MKPQSQIEISAQAWECTSCGGRDPKSCSCNSTAIMVALREAAEKHATRNEAQRKLMRERRALANAPVENIKESGGEVKVCKHCAGDHASRDCDFDGPQFEEVKTDPILKVRNLARESASDARAAQDFLKDIPAPDKAFDDEARERVRDVAETWQAIAEQIGAGSGTEASADARREPTQAEILAGILLLWNAASETTRERILERIGNLINR
jgi:hypothetical protein